MTVQGAHLGKHESVGQVAPDGTPQPTSPRVNISPAERAGRVGLGAASAIAAVVLIFLATSGLAVFLELLLLAAGVDLLVTGITGHCPLYQRLAYVPRALRSPR